MFFGKDIERISETGITMSYIPGKGARIFRRKLCGAHFGGLVSLAGNRHCVCAKGCKTHQFSARTRWYLHVFTAAYWTKKMLPHLHGIYSGNCGHLKQTVFQFAWSKEV